MTQLLASAWPGFSWKSTRKAQLQPCFSVARVALTCRCLIAVLWFNIAVVFTNTSSWPLAKCGDETLSCQLVLQSSLMSFEPEINPLLQHRWNKMECLMASYLQDVARWCQNFAMWLHDKTRHAWKAKHCVAFCLFFSQTGLKVLKAESQNNDPQIQISTFFLLLKNTAAISQKWRWGKVNIYIRGGASRKRGGVSKYLAIRYTTWSKEQNKNKNNNKKKTCGVPPRRRPPNPPVGGAEGCWCDGDE